MAPNEPDFDALAAAARTACAGGGGVHDGEEVFDRLARPLRPRLVFALQRETRCRADAEDAAQAALLRLWQKLELWDPQRPFMPWCFTVAFRCLRDQQRWAKRRIKPGATSPRDRADPAPGPSDTAAADETTDRVWAIARDVLSPAAWTELWLHYGEGLTPTEIAEATGRRAVAVRVGLHRSRKKLAPHLTDASDSAADPVQPRPKESVTS